MTTPQEKAKKQPKAAKARSGGKPATAGTKEQPTSDSAKLTKSATKKKKKPATGKGKKAPPSSYSASSKRAKKRSLSKKEHQSRDRPARQPTHRNSTSPEGRGAAWQKDRLRIGVTTSAVE